MIVDSEPRYRDHAILGSLPTLWYGAVAISSSTEPWSRVGNGSLYFQSGNLYQKTASGWRTFTTVTGAKAAGATGNGTTDDTAAINALITATSDGGAIYFEPGTYLISAPLTVSSGKSISFIGESTNTSIIAAASGFSGDAMLIQEFSASGQALNVQISDLTFSADGNAARCLWIQKGKAFRITDLYLFGFTTTGLQLAGNGGSGAVSYDHRITGLAIDGDSTVGYDNAPAYGIHMSSGATDNKIAQSSISYCKTAGVLVQAGNNLFSQVHCWGGIDYGFQVSTGGQSLIGCYMDTCRIAGLAISANYLSIVGCIFYHNTANTLSVDPADGIKLLTNVQGISIVGNRFAEVDADLNMNAKTLTNSLAVANHGASIASTELLTGNVLLNGAALTGGAQTATGTWTSTEQDMLQKAYDALRSLGVLA